MELNLNFAPVLQQPLQSRNSADIIAVEEKVQRWKGMLAERVRELREARGLSQNALAKAAGLSHTFIGRIESGVARRPSYDTLRRLADALDVPIGRLLMEMDEVELPEPDEDGTSAVGPALEAMQVNLRKIGELNPAAVEQLSEIILAVKEQEERKHREDQRAQRRKSRSTPETGSPDRPALSPPTEPGAGGDRGGD